MKFLEKIQSLWSGHGVLEMDKLKKIEDIKTAEIAQKVLAARKVCGRTACSKCYIGDVTCAVAVKAAQDVLEAGEHLLDVDDIKPLRLRKGLSRNMTNVPARFARIAFLTVFLAQMRIPLRRTFSKRQNHLRSPNLNPLCRLSSGLMNA